MTYDPLWPNVVLSNRYRLICIPNRIEPRPIGVIVITPPETSLSWPKLAQLWCSREVCGEIFLIQQMLDTVHRENIFVISSGNQMSTDLRR